MKRSTIIGLVAAGSVMAASGLAPIAARADSLQDQKNNMRNLAILGGAAAVLGIAQHNSGLAIAGALGAAVAGSQYEHDRQVQSEYNNDYGYGWNGRDYHGRYDNGYRDGGRYQHHWDNNQGRW